MPSVTTIIRTRGVTLQDHVLAESEDGERSTVGQLFFIGAVTLTFHLCLYIYGRFVPHLMVTTPFMLIVLYLMSLLRGMLPVVVGHHRYYSSQFLPEIIKALRIGIGGVLFFGLAYVATGFVPLPSDPIRLLLLQLLGVLLLNGVGLVMLFGGLMGVISLSAISMKYLYWNQLR